MTRHPRPPGYALHALLAPYRPRHELQAARQPHPPTRAADQLPASRTIPISGMHGALAAAVTADAVAAATMQA